MLGQMLRCSNFQCFCVSFNTKVKEVKSLDNCKYLLMSHIILPPGIYLLVGLLRYNEINVRANVKMIKFQYFCVSLYK